MYKVGVPENPYRVVEDTVVAEETIEDALEECTEELEEEAVNKTVEIVPAREDTIMREPYNVADYTGKIERYSEVFTDEKYEADIEVEQDVQVEQIAETSKVPELPFNKADYMRMSVAEKVRCYGFDTRGTDKAFDMVKAYFESVGMDAGFDDVYEEAKLLTDYCAKEVAECQISEKVERIINGVDLCEIDLNQLSKYSADLLAVVFDFNDVDYYTGIKVFSDVMNRKGVCTEQQERYELFEKIYEEGMRERKQEKNRGGRE